MRHTAAPTSRTKVLTALALFFALALACLPQVPARAAQRSSGAGRPRRVNNATQPRTTPAPQATPAPATARPATTTVASPAQATPSPTPSRPAQATPSPTPPDSSGEEVDESDVVRVESNLVNLQVRVIDRNNRPVENVRKEEFRILENGVPQTIELFTKEEVPISYGLVVDNSGSLRAQLVKVIDAGKTIVNSNKPGDETLVIRFIDSDKIEEVQSFTANQEELLDAIENFHVDGGQTAVVDAVYVAAERIAQHKKGDVLNDRRRRAMILVTDGEDRGSRYKQEQLFEALKEFDVQIYVIGFVNELDAEGGMIRKSPRDKAVNLINRLAKETGGRAFFPTSLSELPQIAQDITRDLRTQYVLSYRPTDKARPGEFRNVRVSVLDAPGKDKRIAVTRSGYTAPGARGAGGAAPANSTPPASSRRP